MSTTKVFEQVCQRQTVQYGRGSGNNNPSSGSVRFSQRRRYTKQASNQKNSSFWREVRSVLTTAIPQLSIVEDKREARGKTRGAHWRSPILQNALDSNRECVFENILVQPRSPAEVLECVKVARQLELHLGVRGAGLAVSMGAFQRGPGMLIDMGSKMNTVSRMDSSKGIVECQAGAKIRDVRSYAMLYGWDMRVFPSLDTSTVAGSLLSHEWGIGSVTWGPSSALGNVIEIGGILVNTSVPQPCKLDAVDASKLLRGDLKDRVIITDVSLALAPRVLSMDGVVAFDSFEDSLKFAKEIAKLRTLILQHVSVHHNNSCRHFEKWASILPEEHHVVTFTSNFGGFETILMKMRECGGKLIFSNENDGLKGESLHDFAFMGGTHRALRTSSEGLFWQALLRDTFEIAEFRRNFPTARVHAEAVVSHSGQLQWLLHPLLVSSPGESHTKVLDRVAEFHKAKKQTWYNPHRLDQPHPFHAISA